MLHVEITRQYEIHSKITHSLFNIAAYTKINVNNIYWLLHKTTKSQHSAVITVCISNIYMKGVYIPCPYNPDGKLQFLLVPV